MNRCLKVSFNPTKISENVIASRNAFIYFTIYATTAVTIIFARAMGSMTFHPNRIN